MSSAVIIFVALVLRISTQAQNHQASSSPLKDLNEFPWSGSHQDRNNLVLQKLRRNMHLDVYKETIPRSLLSSSAVYFRNADGRNISVSLKGKDSSSKKDEIGVITDIDVLNSKLNKTCALHLGPYWSYELCFGKQVNQFHIHQETVMEKTDPDGVRRRYVDDSQAGLRDPNYSLGLYYRQEFTRQGTNQADSNAPIESVIQYFRDGQHCDETGEGRTTEAHLQCCNMPEVTGNGGKSPVALLWSVEETKLCTYSMTVCCPSLCQNVVSDQSLLEMAAQLTRSPCLTRQEEWWTYELCFNSSMTQFHAKLVPVIEDGTQVSLQHVVESKFDLGFPPHHVFTDDTALKERISRQDAWVDGYENMDGDSAALSSFFALARGTGVAPGFLPGKSLLLEFVGGSPCDLLQNQNRSTTVDVSCGVRDVITDITEDRTCHYNVKATSRVLCLSEIFAPKEREVAQIKFVPVHDRIPIIPNGKRIAQELHKQQQKLKHI